MEQTKSQTSKTKKKRKKRRRRSRIYKALSIFLAMFASMLAVLCLAFVVLYKSGEASLVNAVENKTPTAGSFDEEAARVAKEQAGLSTVTWQEDWVALNGKAYEW